MTAQIADRVEIGGLPFDIAGVNGGPMFDPTEHGLQPAGFSSACWRGFVSLYRMEDGLFRLNELVVGSLSKMNDRDLSEAAALFGVQGVHDDSEGVYTFQGLQVPVPFTGGLLLGDGFITELYVHMGFHPGWKFRTVLEIILKNGRLVEQNDRSDEIAKVRDSITSGAIADPDGSHDDLKAWIRRTFELDYARTFPHAPMSK